MAEGSKTERSYIAFISYRHSALGREAAELVQKKIENYVVPAEFREQAGGRRLGFCFRDEDELIASSSLTDSIYYALDHSRYLIVICTPDLPLSEWCEAEIRYFLKTHDREHLLAVLADGDPSVSYSPLMLHEYDDEGNIVADMEPLAANIAGAGQTIDKKALKKEIVRLYAAMLGCSFDELWQRERRARTRRMMTAACVVIAVMSVFLGVVLNRNAQIAAQNVRIMEQNDRITSQNDELTNKNEEIQKQNEQITDQNIQIEKKNNELQSQLSTVLVDSGLNKLESADTYGALEDALAALESNDPAIYDHRAEKLLADALGAYRCGDLQATLVYEQSTHIIQSRVTDDGRCAILLDQAGDVRCLDLTDYSVRWEYLVKDTDSGIYTANLSDRVLIKSAESLICLSLDDGSVLWEYVQDSPNYFQCISDDGSLFALLDTSWGEGSTTIPPGESGYVQYFRPVYAVILDTTTGSERNRILLPGDEEYGFWLLNSEFREKYFGTDFTDDNTRFLCVLPFLRTDDVSVCRETVFLLDLTTGEVLYDAAPMGEKNSSMIYYDIFLGAGIDSDATSFSVFQIDSRSQNIVFHTFRARNGSYSHTQSEQTFYFGSDTLSLSDVEDKINGIVPMLSHGDHLVFFTDKDILLCHKDNGLIRDFKTESNIVNAAWIDPEKESIEIITEKGSVLRLVLSSESDYALESLDRIVLDQSDICSYISVNGGITENMADGRALIIRESAQGQLLLLHYLSDPSFSVMVRSDGSVELDETEVMVGLLPGSDTGMLLLSNFSVLTFDRETGGIRSRSEMNEPFTHGIQDAILLDETHFVQRNQLYSIEDGTVSDYIERVSADDLYDAEIYRNRYTVNGDVLTTGMYYGILQDESAPSEDNYRVVMIYDLWINDQFFSHIGTLDVTEGDIPVPLIGENGTVMLYGDAWDDDSPESFLEFWDLYHDWEYHKVPEFPEDVKHMAALGTETPVGALLYENGLLYLLSFEEDGSLRTMSVYRSDTNVFSAQNEALAMCFSEGDQYLLMISSAGRLEILDNTPILESAGQEHEEHMSLLRFNETCIPDPENIRDLDTLGAELSEDGSTMYIYTGYENHSYNAFFMDTDSWTLKAEIPHAYTWDKENNRVYCYTDNVDGNGTSAIIAYPVHSLEDLKAWARKVLDERPGNEKQSG